MSYIEIQGLCAGYGKSRILRDIDFSMDEGEAVAVIGKNGAGKSTLLMSFFGATDIQGGKLLVAGTDLHSLPSFRTSQLGISISPQGRMILPNLTVKENLLLGAASGRPGHWTLDKVFDLFPVLRERQSRAGTALSGGQQQMIAIGRALLGNPRVLFLDEPSEGLSPVLVDELVAVLDQVQKTGTGILVVEQHLSLVSRVTQRFIVMSKGGIIDAGLTADIGSPTHRASLAF